MNQLAIHPLLEQQVVSNLHPLLHKLIQQIQPELLEPCPEAVTTLQAVLQWLEGKPRNLPKALTPELQLALQGLKKLKKKMDLDLLELSLEWREHQMRRKLAPLLEQGSK